MHDVQALNEALFERLSDQKMEADAIDAVNDFTRTWPVWSMTHIPYRFYIPDFDEEGNTTPGLSRYLGRLYDELGRQGVLRLDVKGNIACLTGKRPMMRDENLHGPWQEDAAPAYEEFYRIRPPVKVINHEP